VSEAEAGKEEVERWNGCFLEACASVWKMAGGKKREGRMLGSGVSVVLCVFVDQQSQWSQNGGLVGRSDSVQLVSIFV
jgi:hypothetical protein